MDLGFFASVDTISQVQQKQTTVHLFLGLIMKTFK